MHLSCHPGRPSPKTAVAVGAATVRGSVEGGEASLTSSCAPAPGCPVGEPQRSEARARKPGLRIPRLPRQGHQSALRSTGASSAAGPRTRYRPSEKLLPGATRSSTTQNQRSGRPDCMPQPRRPPPVSHRSQGLWPVAFGSFPLPLTWPSSQALHTRDRRGLLQKIPYSQPALAAASLHRG